MTDKGDDLDVLGAIRPAHDEVSSYRRSGRSEAPKQSNFNGILVFVIVVMAIMMGVGGFTIYEVQKKLDQSNLLLARGQENVQELENRLSATGTDVSKTLQNMKDQMATNVSEIDKLWGVSHRQNKPAIQKNEAELARVATEIRGRLQPMSAAVDSVTRGFEKLSSETAAVRKAVLEDSEEMTTQVAIVRGQIQDQVVLVEGNRRQIAILAKQMKEAQEAIDVIDQYRRQINQRLMDLQMQVQNGDASRTTSP